MRSWMAFYLCGLSLMVFGFFGIFQKEEYLGAFMVFLGFLSFMFAIITQEWEVLRND